MTSLSISPDGELVATTCDGGAVCLWRAKTGEPVATLKGHSDVGAVCFSRDGTLLFSGGRDATIRTWSVESAKEVHRFALPPTTRVFDLAVSPDGGRFAAAMFNLSTGKSTTAIWNVGSDEPTRELKGHSNIIWSLAWAPDGQSLATASADKSVRLWPLAAKAKPKVMKGHQGVVRRVRFSPDGATLLSGASDHTLRRWSASGAPLTTQSFDHGVHAFDAFADGARVIVGLSPPGSKDGARSELHVVSL